MDTKLKKFWDLGIAESLRLEKEFPIDDDNPRDHLCAVTIFNYPRICAIHNLGYFKDGSVRLYVRLFTVRLKRGAKRLNSYKFFSTLEKAEEFVDSLSLSDPSLAVISYEYEELEEELVPQELIDSIPENIEIVRTTVLYRHRESTYLQRQETL